MLLPLISIPLILGLPYLTKKFHKLFKHDYVCDEKHVMRLQTSVSSGEGSITCNNCKKEITEQEIKEGGYLHCLVCSQDNINYHLDCAKPIKKFLKFIGP